MARKGGELGLVKLRQRHVSLEAQTVPIDEVLNAWMVGAEGLQKQIADTVDVQRLTVSVSQAANLPARSANASLVPCTPVCRGGCKTL